MKSVKMNHLVKVFKSGLRSRISNGYNSRIGNVSRLCFLASFSSSGCLLSKSSTHLSALKAALTDKSKALSAIESYAKSIETSESPFQDVSTVMQTVKYSPLCSDPSILNSLIIHFSKYNYSVVTQILQQMEFSKLSIKAINMILQYNPGRVATTYELFQDFCSKSPVLVNTLSSQNPFSTKIISHVLLSEITEDSETCESLSDDTASRILSICQQYEFEILDRVLLQNLLHLFSEKGELSLFTASCHTKVRFSGNEWKEVLLKIPKTYPPDILRFIETVWGQLVGTLDDDVVTSICDIALVYKYQEMENEVGVNTIGKEEYVKLEKFLRDTVSPVFKNFPSSPSLIKFFGIVLNDLHTVAQHSLKNKECHIATLKVMVYHSLMDGTFTEAYKSNIDELTSQSFAIPYLILIHHRDLDKSIQIFNDNVKQNSPELVKALLQTVLLNNNRELAMVILEKSLENKLIHNTYEMKQILKQYGEGNFESYLVKSL